MEQAAIHPDDFPDEDKTTIENTIKDTITFLSSITKIAKGRPFIPFTMQTGLGLYAEKDMAFLTTRLDSQDWLGNNEVSRLFLGFMKTLNSSIKFQKEASGMKYYETRLSQLSWLFLNLAKELEMLLEDLNAEMQEKDQSDIIEYIASGIQRLGIRSADSAP